MLRYNKRKKQTKRTVKAETTQQGVISFDLAKESIAHDSPSVCSHRTAKSAVYASHRSLPALISLRIIRWPCETPDWAEVSHSFLRMKTCVAVARPPRSVNNGKESSILSLNQPIFITRGPMLKGKVSDVGVVAMLRHDNEETIGVGVVSELRT
jgi:hypothetical protein